MKISYILPITRDTGIRLINTENALKYLDDTFASIISQSIPNWELIVVVEKNLEAKVAEIWQRVAAKYSSISYQQNELSSNIRFTAVNTKNTAAACNAGLGLCKGKFVGVIQAGDKLAETTTYELIQCIVENSKVQFIYTDHDHIDLQGKRFKPFFKPDLNPDLIYCQNYIHDLALVRKTLLKKLHGWNIKYSAAYDYELNLNAISTLVKLDRPDPKILGSNSPINHISRILYHRRVNLKLPPKTNQCLALRPNKIDEIKQSQQGLAVIKTFFKAQGRKVKVSLIKPKLYRHHWEIAKPEPLVSLIIPTRDGYEILKTCVQSILTKTTYKNYEILIIDNQSTERRSIEYMKNLERNYTNIRILKYNKPFNYSAINNFAATKAKGTILGLINNDTEVITHEWLNEMVSHAVRPEIGCVGAMLYYPDGSVQHAGVLIGPNGPFHISSESGKCNSDLLKNYDLQRNLIAVTGAVLMIKKSLFKSVKGLDQKYLKIAFNDIDLCLKVNKLFLQNAISPYAKLFHHESKTRGQNFDENLERTFFIKKYKQIIKGCHHEQKN